MFGRSARLRRYQTCVYWFQRACLNPQYKEADRPPMIEWLLIRHAETAWNMARRIQGHSDVPLNANGMQQARLIAERLSDIDLAAIYSSNSSRAFVTARMIADANGAGVTVRPELREKSYGEWEGMTGPEIQAAHPEEFALWQDVRDPAFSVTGGESDLDVRARVRLLIEDLRSAHEDGERIALVGHGGSLRAIASELLGIPPTAGTMLWLANTSVSTLRLHDRFTALHNWNDASHLRNHNG